MGDYLTAYRARLERNQVALIQLIEEVQQKKPSIEAYVYDQQQRLLSGVVFIDGEYITSVQFHEVPYRWSGPGYDEFHKSHSGGENSSMPFDADDVINGMKPIAGMRKSQIESFKNREHYLKWCSYLKLYKEKAIL